MTSERYLEIIRAIVGGWLASAELSKADDPAIAYGFSAVGVREVTRKEYIIALSRLFDAVKNAQVIVRFDVNPADSLANED